jgi:hypothetical protein
MRYILLLIILAYCPLIHAQKGIIIVPVAELVGQPMKTFYPNSDPHTRYTQMPFCSASANASTCPRLHQLLLHEQVDILQEKGDELYIRMPSALYVSHDDKKEHQEFWILKKHVMPYETLKKHAVPMHNFPEPISCTHNSANATQSIITLKQPFFNRATGQHLSAGTRFVACDAKKPSKVVAVYAFDPTTYRFNTIHIPKQFCIFNTPQDKNKCIELFVQILHSWAHQKKPYVIPYVLGGCSFIDTYQAYQFSRTPTLGQNNTQGSGYTYKTAPGATAHGFDCSGIILRAAQMSGIPYFCKNTSAIAATLKPLSAHDTLHNGDLILIPGHVMIVADTQKNTIIEARGYEHGYGNVHEIPLAEQFQNIKTFQNLIDAYNTKKPLVRLNKNGNVVRTIANYNLFKLASVWN